MNRLNDDSCEVWTNLRQSVGPGNYVLSQPLKCEIPFVADPQLSSQGAQVSVCADRPLIDVDSELLGITRRAAKCPQSHYAAGTPSCRLKHPRDATFESEFDPESTRASNPGCTLRCRGWNRWEWLCDDPQSRAEVPFEWFVNYRNVVKDNHRPLIPSMLVDRAQPPPNATCVPVSEASPIVLSELPPQPLMAHWRSCGEVARIKGAGCCKPYVPPAPSPCSNV